MQPFNIKEHTHKRLNLLTGEWILVSPHRNKRPWQGKNETIATGNRPAFDPGCYLCPGNKRADGAVNPDYKKPFVFVNDYSALLPDTPAGSYNEESLLQATAEKGVCKVISFSPDHSLTLPELHLHDIIAIVDTWCEEFAAIAANPEIRYIQIFENKGDIMGCSNPHPHGQIWSQTSLPMEITKETREQKKYFEANGSSLLSDYIALELKKQERIVLESKSFVVVVPFWATWPYETLIVSRRQVPNLLHFDETEREDLANVLLRLTTRYDNLFEVSFPYSAGMHQAPVNDGEHPEWHWHMHFYPPLLRSATVKKFMVGYEMMANPQRDITPESAAEKLRQLSEIHFKKLL